jgi:hypothetical protein
MSRLAAAPTVQRDERSESSSMPYTSLSGIRHPASGIWHPAFLLGQATEGAFEWPPETSSSPLPQAPHRPLILPRPRSRPRPRPRNRRRDRRRWRASRQRRNRPLPLHSRRLTPPQSFGGALFFWKLCT